VRHYWERGYCGDAAAWRKPSIPAGILRSVGCQYHIACASPATCVFASAGTPKNSLFSRKDQRISRISGAGIPGIPRITAIFRPNPANPAENNRDFKARETATLPVPTAKIPLV
jgi:hypothetical protein